MRKGRLLANVLAGVCLSGVVQVLGQDLSLWMQLVAVVLLITGIHFSFVGRQE